MPNKMLIDATHPEETRVVVVRGSRVEDFDFESANRKQLRGNIYLAKVTRVEPSLQAAFVEYGGNRHGFLAFSEIHPDYYQIPVADRQALIDAEAADAEAEAVERDRRHKARAAEMAASEDTIEDNHAETNGDAPHDEDEEHVESVGQEDALEEVPERRQKAPRARQYKIQEVIKRRQVMLVQVVKEERGTKGAALTTYLSLAGRYSVLMPNSGRGGGISRKITSAEDRRRLKEVASDLEVPEGMGIILRTAGASRTKAEIKRDFEYLLRLWENVRDLTLRSSAPMLVYEEGSLVKRSIRDLYNKDIDEVLVSGEDAYREAKDFMRMLMPSHARNVQPYRELTPIFARFSVEPQLDAMFSPQVTLRSGGYIVINQTEALVSIDVNSGRSTREHNIEDTALQTNLEASEEVARQLRLRDLAGLIVIDFIDMEEPRNNKAVEKKLKDCLKNDRARIQVGRISHFGLMEMSRQRMRTGVLEGSTEVCQHCLGAGIVRSVESVALHVLRSIEDSLLKGVTHHLIIRTRTAVALYILNQKRKHLADLEHRYGVNIALTADEHLTGQHFVLERGEPAIPRAPLPPTQVQPDSIEIEDEIEDVVEETEDEAEAAPEASAEGGTDEQRRKRRRRRRRRGGGAEGSDEARSGDQEASADAEDDAEGAVAAAEGESDAETEGEAGGDEPRRSRRRGRRGGRRGRSESAEISVASDFEREPEPRSRRVNGADDDDAEDTRSAVAEAGDAGGPTEIIDLPLVPPGHDEGESHDDAVLETPEPQGEPELEPAAEPEAAPEVEPQAEPEPEVALEREPEPAAAAPRTPEPVEDDRPKRSGWWQRRSFF
jgi:ribonuclease E